MLSTLICPADCALRMEDPARRISGNNIMGLTRRMKRSQSYKGPPYKRALSDLSSCTQEDMDLVSSEMDTSLGFQSYPQERCIIPPAPSPEKCARNARAKMVLLLLDRAEEAEEGEPIGLEKKQE